MFWAQVRLILTQTVRRRLKWAVTRAQNIFMTKIINCIATIGTLEGTEKIKNWKKKIMKGSEEYFFHQRCKKTSTNTKTASAFVWMRKMYHKARWSDN